MLLRLLSDSYNFVIEIHAKKEHTVFWVRKNCPQPSEQHIHSENFTSCTELKAAACKVFSFPALTWSYKYLTHV